MRGVTGAGRHVKTSRFVCGDISFVAESPFILMRCEYPIPEREEVLQKIWEVFEKQLFYQRISNYFET